MSNPQRAQGIYRPSGSALLQKGGAEGHSVANKESMERVSGPEASTAALQQSSFDSESNLLTAKLLAAGGIAGAVSKTATAPLARLTILFQVRGMLLNKPGSSISAASPFSNQPSIIKEATRIVRQEGWGALWKGNGVTIVHRLPYSAVNFLAYERFTEHLSQMTGEEETRGMAMVRRLVAGGGAGSTACIIAYPLDLVRTRLAVQTTDNYYNGIGHALRMIVKDEGFRGLYRGLGATLMGVGPNLAINFCGYETLRAEYLRRHPELDGSPTVAVSLACGSVAGLTSSTVAFPFDLVRRRMQLQGQGGQPVMYKNFWDCLKSVVRKEGFHGLYRGILPEYYKVVPGVGIAFSTYELLKQVLECDTEDNWQR